MQACSDTAFGLLCQLLETPERMMHADGARLSEYAPAYQYLIDLGALTPGNTLESDVLCPWCGMHALEPVADPRGGYHGHCFDCGWISLPSQYVKPLHAEPGRIARWLAAALGLTDRFRCEMVLPDVLWRLGEIEHRRKRRVMFFGSRLESHAGEAADCFSKHAAPGAAVVITTTAPALLSDSRLSAYLCVPLRAVAHLRKAGFVIENLDAYLDQPGSAMVSDETSLRLLHSQHVALIDGEQHKLSPQVYQFLSLLESADGKALHKRTISDKLEIAVDTFKAAAIFKRHKEVYGTFIDSDGEGRYWLKGDFSH